MNFERFPKIWQAAQRFEGLVRGVATYAHELGGSPIASIETGLAASKSAT
jgi:hypothetical protein